jgi:hypothetical protein
VYKTKSNQHDTGKEDVCAIALLYFLEQPKAKETEQEVPFFPFLFFFRVLFIELIPPPFQRRKQGDQRK